MPRYPDDEETVVWVEGELGKLPEAEREGCAVQETKKGRHYVFLRPEWADGEGYYDGARQMERKNVDMKTMCSTGTFYKERFFPHGVPANTKHHACYYWPTTRGRITCGRKPFACSYLKPLVKNTHNARCCSVEGLGSLFLNCWFYACCPSSL